MVTMPLHLNARDILKKALEHDVAFVPRDDFFIGDTGHNTFRLNLQQRPPGNDRRGHQAFGCGAERGVGWSIVPGR